MYPKYQRKISKFYNKDLVMFIIKFSNVGQNFHEQVEFYYIILSVINVNKQYLVLNIFCYCYMFVYERVIDDLYSEPKKLTFFLMYF